VLDPNWANVRYDRCSGLSFCGVDVISRQTWQVDLLILFGLALLGLGLWLRFGDAAVAMYAGTVLIVIGVLLSTTGQRGSAA